MAIWAWRERCRSLREDEGKTWKEVAAICREETGDTFTDAAIRVRFRDSQSPPHRPFTITAGPAPRIPPEVTWAQAEKVTSADVERHLTERLVSIAVEDDRPIGISVTSDHHIRLSGPVMLKQMREDAELAARTDGLYSILGGDGPDNHIKHRAAMVGGGSKPSEEWRLYDQYLRFFGPDKILAMISGNHDDWTRDFAGVDMVAQLAERNAVHYAPDDILLTLDLNGISYRIKVRHQYRYNSSFNLTHAVKRLWEMGEDPFDIGVICHHHEAAIEPFTKHGRQIWAARPGSYQVNSSHGRRYGFNNSRPTCPTFILFPDRKEVLGFPDIWQGANVLAVARQLWPEGWRRRSA